ncbi:MAG: hypothetical protein M1816_005232, partial [Peltula sp. TS41687]
MPYGHTALDPYSGAWSLQKHSDCLDSSEIGADFCHRTHAALEYSNFLTDSDHRTAYLQVLRQPEQHTLEQLYKPKLHSKHATTDASLSPELHEFIEELRVRQEGSRINSSTIHSSALEQVEQEREVAFEIEEVPEVQKPVHFEALSLPGLHPVILNITKTGELLDSPGYEQASTALKRTGLGLEFGINAAATPSRLYVSTEFKRTVKMKGQPNDKFLV